MTRFLVPVVFACLGLLCSANQASAAGGCAGCATPAPSCEMTTSAAPVGGDVQLSQSTRSVRSYSYEPAASNRSYGRSYSRPASGGFNNATTKARGNY